MKTDYDYLWGSHLPVLIKAMSLTKGSVLEMGMGLYSTPFLHWVCYKERILVSYDNNKKFFDLNKQYRNSLHEVHLIDDWSKANIEKPWDVALIDHSPSYRRLEDIKRLAPFVKYMVVHDTQRGLRFCDWRKVWPLFKYRYDYTQVSPYTSVVSNLVDVSVDFL